MQGFVDETVIEVASGNGGSGAVSFRREKYVAKGGPDGGDGGKGGDVVFHVKENLNTLSHLKIKRKHQAENGQPGMGRRMHGRDGNDMVIDVPPGTIIRDYETKEVLADLKEVGSHFVLLSGGRGGQGNWHFRSSKRQVPRFAQPGVDGIEKTIVIELNLIADIGFVGFPNAGKSSLLKNLTNAHPQVAAYAFTTKIPNLGMLYVHGKDVVLADIPGIIEGASSGVGLGFRFLKHIARTRGLAFMLDISDENYLTVFDTLLSELKKYAPELIEKPRIILANKIELEGFKDRLVDLKDKYPEEQIIGMSNYSKEGIEQVKQAFYDLSEA
ncbi:GTPase ObgE [Spirochaeta cellobiosiphila]|uniref:GTPase ObgE n=1 Tax=Spirochaeta cellobiosiphila TaxID=504483 RepID=UPI0004907A20|nr:GTPase ObgE [Spirochaeta cellobiosiphila]